jgi:PAS domain S-box-containing protein
VVLQHADGSIRESNPSAERILGLSADQLMGRTSIDPRWRAIHEDGSPFLGENHPAMMALRTGRPCTDVVMGVHHPDGTLAWISVNAQPLFRDDEPTAYAVVTAFVDITQQRQRDEAIRQQEARYRALFEQSIDAILIATGDGRLIAANHEAMRLFDVTEEELRAGGRLQIQDPEDPRWAQAIHERDSTGMFRGELRFRRRDGTSFPCDVGALS